MSYEYAYEYTDISVVSPYLGVGSPFSWMPPSIEDGLRSAHVLS